MIVNKPISWSDDDIQSFMNDSKEVLFKHADLYIREDLYDTEYLLIAQNSEDTINYVHFGDLNSMNPVLKELLEGDEDLDTYFHHFHKIA